MGMISVKLQRYLAAVLLPEPVAVCHHFQNNKMTEDITHRKWNQNKVGQRVWGSACFWCSALLSLPKEHSRLCEWLQGCGFCWQWAWLLVLFKAVCGSQIWHTALVNLSRCLPHPFLIPHILYRCSWKIAGKLEATRFLLRPILLFCCI